MNGGLTAIERVEAELLDPAGLDFARIAGALGEMSAGADLADLYFENARERHWRLEDGTVVGGGFAIRQGVGARAARHGQVAFAHGSDLRPDALLDTVRAVRAMHRHGDAPRHPGGVSLDRGGAPVHRLYAAEDVVGVDDAAAWIALLETADRQARACDPRVVRVDARIVASDRTMLVADLDGRIAADRRPSARLGLSVLVEANGRRAQGRAGLGGRYGVSGFGTEAVAAAAARAVRIATVNLDARPAPAGTMPVVLAPGYAGVLFHEAVGHGLEGDHHRQSLSAFAGRIGERIAAPGVTVVDDGSVAGRLGSLGVDDEGTPGQRTVLVEDGVLTGLMQDRLNAGLMNARSTGNARRQSYAHLPLPRMTNTFLERGDATPADIVSSVERGLYASEIGGGQVNIVTGRFNFTTAEAWLIEDGRITTPVDGATLIGVGHEALRGISMIGNDFAFDSGEALCGKQGQTLDVSVGQPTLRIDGMTVGGRAG